jgi:hypothetical protein
MANQLKTNPLCRVHRDRGSDQFLQWRRSQPPSKLLQQSISSWVGFAASVAGLTTCISAGFSQSRAQAAPASATPPTPISRSQFPRARPANFLGDAISTSYSAYCQPDSLDIKPLCGGVGDGDPTPANRADFVPDPEIAPLEPIVLYQYNKVTVLSGSVGE